MAADARAKLRHDAAAAALGHESDQGALEMLLHDAMDGSGPASDELHEFRSSAVRLLRQKLAKMPPGAGKVAMEVYCRQLDRSLADSVAPVPELAEAPVRSDARERIDLARAVALS